METEAPTGVAHRDAVLQIVGIAVRFLERGGEGSGERGLRLPQRNEILRPPRPRDA